MISCSQLGANKLYLQIKQSKTYRYRENRKKGRNAQKKKKSGRGEFNEAWRRAGNSANLARVFSLLLFAFIFNTLGLGFNRIWVADGLINREPSDSVDIERCGVRSLYRQEQRCLGRWISEGIVGYRHTMPYYWYITTEN